MLGELISAARAAGTAALEEELGALCHQMVAVASVSGQEARICDEVEHLLRQAPHLDVIRRGDCLMARTRLGRSQRLLLAGHLDTVPEARPAQPVRYDGAVIEGRGAVDMKAGLAVMVRLAVVEAASATRDTTFVFYDREETGSHTSGMNRLVKEAGELLTADAAVLLEPTGGWLEPGCQGSLRVRVGFDGEAAHTARPWQGRNAVARAMPAAARCAAHRPVPVVVDGLDYPQAFELVGVAGGGDSNVVPDRCTFHVNIRYAPDRTRDEVLAELRYLVGTDADDFEVTLDSPAAAPGLGHPVLRKLAAAVDGAIRPKLGWTDVGRLVQLGLPAVNFGPGDPELAHTERERVEVAELLRVHQVLAGVMNS